MRGDLCSAFTGGEVFTPRPTPSHLSSNRTFSSQHSQRRMRVLIQLLRRHFQFTFHWSSRPHTFYSTNSINLTLPSGIIAPYQCLLKPARFILIPSFLVGLWYGHYLSAHVHLSAWLCSEKKTVQSWACSKNVKSPALRSVGRPVCQSSTLTSPFRLL